MARMAKLWLTEFELRALQEELTEWLAANDERRPRAVRQELERALEKVEHASKNVVMVLDRKELETLIRRMRRAGGIVLVTRDGIRRIQNLAICVCGVSSRVLDPVTGAEWIREWLAKRNGMNNSLPVL
jgi:hypothetical protein